MRNENKQCEGMSRKSVLRLNAQCLRNISADSMNVVIAVVNNGIAVTALQQLLSAAVAVLGATGTTTATATATALKSIRNYQLFMFNM
uniref:Spore coat protein n=1 Tax=Syphacia muris TaxID=451379 RepID=A0A0N5AEF5_9BILA